MSTETKSNGWRSVAEAISPWAKLLTFLTVIVAATSVFFSTAFTADQATFDAADNTSAIQRHDERIRMVEQAAMVGEARWVSVQARLGQIDRRLERIEERLAGRSP